MVLPMWVPFAVFNLLPVFWIIVISFTSFNGVAAPEWIGLDNFAFLIQDRLWWRSVRNTGLLAVGVTLIQVPLALMLAVLLKRTHTGSSTFRTIFFLPYVTAISVMGVIFAFMLRPHEGILNDILLDIGLISTPIDFLGHPITAMASLVAVSVWAEFGLTMVLFLAGLEGIPDELYEASLTEGANAFQQFRYITFPLLKPVMAIAVLLALIFAVRSFDIVKTLTNSGPAGATEVIYTYMFDYFFQSTRATQLGYGAAIAVAATAIAAMVAVAYRLLVRKGRKGT